VVSVVVLLDKTDAVAVVVEDITDVTEGVV
jgi:hypothetical protein